MASRTVRLDDDTEKVLDQLVEGTGLSISGSSRKASWRYVTGLQRIPLVAPMTFTASSTWAWRVCLGSVHGNSARCPGSDSQEALSVILVDTGPFVALFDPKDGQHNRCAEVLKTLQERLSTTVPVLTEAFHILDPTKSGLCPAP